jgi:hypothetical protein
MACKYFYLPIYGASSSIIYGASSSIARCLPKKFLQEIFQTFEKHKALSDALYLFS